jgi:hypothetical protein
MRANHLKGLRSLKTDHPNIKRRLVICSEDKLRMTDDGIEIIPAAIFIEMLWQGKKILIQRFYNRLCSNHALKNGLVNRYSSSI